MANNPKKYHAWKLGRMKYIFIDGTYIGKMQWKEKRGETTHNLDPDRIEEENHESV